jgi:hypothetical protein
VRQGRDGEAERSIRLALGRRRTHRLPAAPERIDECDQKDHEEREARPVVALAERQFTPLAFRIAIPIVLPAPAHDATNR